MDGLGGLRRHEFPWDCWGESTNGEHFSVVYLHVLSPIYPKVASKHLFSLCPFLDLSRDRTLTLSMNESSAERLGDARFPPKGATIWSSTPQPQGSIVWYLGKRHPRQARETAYRILTRPSRRDGILVPLRCHWMPTRKVACSLHRKSINDDTLPLMPAAFKNCNLYGDLCRRPCCSLTACCAPRPPGNVPVVIRPRVSVNWQ